MKKEDLLYSDEEYEIYKKNSGEVGTFLPFDCLQLLLICLTQLETFENANFLEEKEYEKILDRTAIRIKNLPR